MCSTLLGLETSSRLRQLLARCQLVKTHPKSVHTACTLNSSLAPLSPARDMRTSAGLTQQQVSCTGWGVRVCCGGGCCFFLPSVAVALFGSSFTQHKTFLVVVVVVCCLLFACLRLLFVVCLLACVCCLFLLPTAGSTASALLRPTRPLRRYCGALAHVDPPPARCSLLLFLAPGCCASSFDAPSCAFGLHLWSPPLAPSSCSFCFTCVFARRLSFPHPHLRTYASPLASPPPPHVG